MRRLELKDIETIQKMIKGTDLDIRYIAAKNTFILDNKGFITLYFYKGMPVLQHFFTTERHINTARELVKGLLELLRASGHKHFITSACDDKLKKVIEYYFKIKPIDRIDNNDYYLVEV